MAAAVHSQNVLVIMPLCSLYMHLQFNVSINISLEGFAQLSLGLPEPLVLKV